MKFVSLILIILAWKLYHPPHPKAVNPDPIEEIQVRRADCLVEEDEDEVFSQETSDGNNNGMQDLNVNALMNTKEEGVNRSPLRRSQRNSSTKSRFSRTSMKLIAPLTSDSNYDPYE